MKVMLVTATGRNLGVLSIDEKDTIVWYGGGYFGRDHHTGTTFRGDLMPIFRQPKSILIATKLDVEFPAHAADGE